MNPGLVNVYSVACAEAVAEYQYNRLAGIL